jgi:hypothetical protein
METADKLIPILKTLGFIEIDVNGIRRTDYKEIIEYYDGKNWRIFGIK